MGKYLWNVRICKPHGLSITSLDRKGLSCTRCNSYRKTNSAKPALMLYIGALSREVYRRWVAYVARYTNREEARSIDARTTRVSVHTGPCIRAHVVSNRYRGYRQTGGEINTHRPAASTTTTTTSMSVRPHINTYTYLYIAYISARQRRDRGFAEIALVSRYVDSVTRAHIRGVPSPSVFSLIINSRLDRSLIKN